MTRKRSLSCYIRNEDSSLKTKNGEKNGVEKDEGEGRKKRGRKRRDRNVVRSMGLPTGFTLRCIPRRCGPHAANISVGSEGDGYSAAANVGHELRFDISNFTRGESAAYELELNKSRPSCSDHGAVARNRISFRR